MMTKDKQQRYRARLQAQGYKQIAVWIDADAVIALQALQAMDAADAYTVVSAALKHYHAARQQPTGRAQARRRQETTA